MKPALVRCNDMPMTTCAHCQLPTYTAARWSTRDECVRCGAAIKRTGPPYPSVMSGSLRATVSYQSAA